MKVRERERVALSSELNAVFFCFFVFFWLFIRGGTRIARLCRVSRYHFCRDVGESRTRRQSRIDIWQKSRVDKVRVFPASVALLFVGARRRLALG